MSLWRRLCCCFTCCCDEEDQQRDDHRDTEEHREREEDESTPSPHAGSVLIDVQPTADELELQAIHPAPYSSLTPHQHARARTLASWSSLDLAWRVLKDPDPNGRGACFYFNAFTGKTVWNPPEDVKRKRTLQNQQTDLLLPGTLDWSQDIIEFFRERNIQLLLWSDHRSGEQEFLEGHEIRGRCPNLLHVLFYSHVLRTEFSLYPTSYLHRVGLHRVVLVDNLSYDGQPRNACPLVETGTLLLDPKIEEVVYVANVLHHELFHAVDCHMIYRAKERMIREGKRGQTLAHHDDQDHDFTTPLPMSLPPLSKNALNVVSSLHGVIDPAWSRLNDSNFSYGSGGAYERGNHMFLSHGRAGSPTQGFLNGYSQTALEEDKAEVYATLMRDGSLADSTDPILRAKAREIQRRLRWFCPELDEHFWSNVARHTPHPSRPPLRIGSPVELDDWIQKTDHAGHTYFFNRITQQTSWVKPV